VVAEQIEKECIATEPTLWSEEWKKNSRVSPSNTLTETRTPKLTNPLSADVFSQTIIDASIKTIEPEPRVINIIQVKIRELR
jgi:hypothetical protein